MQPADERAFLRGEPADDYTLLPLLKTNPSPGGFFRHVLLSNPVHYVFPHRLPRQRRRKSLNVGLVRRKTNIQLLTVDHSARGSMKTAASCVSVCESQEYQIHRQVERTLRRRHSHVLPSLLHEGRMYIECIGFANCRRRRRRTSRVSFFCWDA